MLRTVNVIASVGIALLVANCAGTPIGSIAGGECKLVQSPPYAVLGKTKYDQKWVDRTEEAIVTGCGQPRPKVRPASLDAHHTVAGKTVPLPAVSVPATAPIPPKKKHWWQRKAKAS